MTHRDQHPLRKHYPVLIIGAGLAGSAAACTLAGLGHQVAVLEKDLFPRDKLCGEFLSGESARLLKELGCMDTVLGAHPAQMEKMTFISPAGSRVVFELPSKAFGISRFVLDAILAEHARACGAEFQFHSEVRDLRIEDGYAKAKVLQRDSGNVSEVEISADLVIACYGRRTGIDQHLGRRFVRRRHGYVAFKRHHTLAPGPRGEDTLECLRKSGEMYLLRGGYCGFTLIEGNRVNVCMLLKQSVLKTAGATTWSDVMQHNYTENRMLKERMDTLSCLADEPVLSVAQIPIENKELFYGPIMFAGDAAGMITPLCGDGQAMAIESGIILGQLVHKFGSSIPDLQKNWSREWSRLFGTRMRLGRLLQPLIMEPTVAEIAMKLLNRFSPLRRSLAAATRGK